MYSERVVQSSVESLEASLKLKLVRYPLPYVLERKSQLSSLATSYDARTGAAAEFVRPLNPEEAQFVTNERLLSRLDYSYWLSRYCTIIRDPVSGGGEGTLEPWESQKLLLKVIADTELREWEKQQADPTAPADGCLIALNKARQIGATMMSRSLLMHRVTLCPSQRGMSSSVDDDKLMELYSRDKLILDSLPWYMRPPVEFDVKASHLAFAGLRSFMLYQMATQNSGLGQGRQFDIAHLTELASYPYPMMLENDFFPTLPQGRSTLGILESTPQGRGNWWHEFTEKIRRGAYTRWQYVFIPWYIEPRKYRRTPPADWSPSTVSMQHAKKVYETAPALVGKAVFLSKEQLYWYETSRNEAMAGGTLNLFLTNYASTPEESFQHTSQSAFAHDVLESLRLTTRPGTSYEFSREVA